MDPIKELLHHSMDGVEMFYMRNIIPFEIDTPRLNFLEVDENLIGMEIVHWYLLTVIPHLQNM